MRLVVDTDTASDDAVALLMAGLDDRATIVAATTVAGNVPLDIATRNAMLALDLAGVPDVPVYAGCDRPLVRPLDTARDVHGEDGMGDIGVVAPHRDPADGHAVDVLLDLPRRFPRELTLVTLGPLTNLAAALVRDRDLLHGFRHVYCMAGAPDAIGNVGPTAEYNVWADPEAAEIVAQAASADQVTWIGWDVSRQDAVMTSADQQRLQAVETPAAVFAHRINRTVYEWARNITGLDGYDLPDPVAMAVAIDPSLATETERAHVRIALDGSARGQMIVDRRLTAAPPNLSLVRRADEQRFKNSLLTALSKNPENDRDHTPRTALPS